MKHLLTVVGARPQLIKSWAVSIALGLHGLEEKIIHTGQHYDDLMSKTIIEELGIKIYKNLNVNQVPYETQLELMIDGIKNELTYHQPDGLIVYGDTTSTLAGAVAAHQTRIPLIHVEAGLRSFNQAMPEEHNRIATDHLSTILFVPTLQAIKNLHKEGLKHNVFNVGDVMYDAVRLANPKPPKFKMLDSYYLLTLHRNTLLENYNTIQEVFRALAKAYLPFIFPVHPHTLKIIKAHGIEFPDTVIVSPPVSYLEMLYLIKHSKAVFTDSGGVQKEAVMLGKHCYTLRSETEWIETVRTGWNALIGTSYDSIKKVLISAGGEKPKAPFPISTYYGDGKACHKIAKALAEF